MEKVLLVYNQSFLLRNGLRIKCGTLGTWMELLIEDHNLIIHNNQMSLNNSDTSMISTQDQTTTLGPSRQNTIPSHSVPGMSSFAPINPERYNSSSIRVMPARRFNTQESNLSSNTSPTTNCITNGDQVENNRFIH